MTMPTSATSTAATSVATPMDGSMPSIASIMSALNNLSDQCNRLVAQGTALQSSQDEMRKELAKVRETGEAVEKRVFAMEIRQEERDKAAKQVEQAKAEAKSDTKDVRDGVAKWVQWVVPVLLTIIGLLITAIVAIWNHK